MNELALQLQQYGTVQRIPYRNTYDRLLRSISVLFAQHEISDLRRQLSTLPVDVIHVNKQNLEDGLELLIAADQARIPMVATIHVTRTMSQLKSLGAGIRDLISFRVLRRLNSQLITIAESGRKDLSAIQFPQQRLHLVRNGVRQADLGDKHQIRSSWGCDPGDFILGCIARLEPQKNPLFLIKLLAQLPNHVKVVWIGDGSLRDALHHEAMKHGVGNRLVMPGWQQNARSSLAGFDMFVLPSYYEGLPFAVLEAMAAGLPCLVSDVDGVAEAVRHRQTGFTCPVNDTESWLNAIHESLTTPSLLAEMGCRGLRRYQEIFSINAMAKNTVAVYETAIAAKSCS